MLAVNETFFKIRYISCREHDHIDVVVYLCSGAHIGVSQITGAYCGKLGNTNSAPGTNLLPSK